MTTRRPSVRPFSGTKTRTYTENEEATHATNPCGVCGRQIDDARECYVARVVYGGARWAMPDATVDECGDPIEPRGDMGAFPIGPTCAKKLGAFAVKSEHLPRQEAGGFGPRP